MSATSDRAARDRADLETAKTLAGKICVGATTLHVATSDKNRYGFIVNDVTLHDGQRLSVADPATLHRLADALYEHLCDLDWRGVVGEDKFGYADIPLPSNPGEANS